ncbi:MAG TPA: hypothetical protein VG323_13155, partial [Thermoanaerobaculia bacterium]|nr:hypothetical protein [Thermoanaerobaculia bacterium]
MTIAAGQRLGPYEILAPLGAGGMGEVWRAHDSRLDRGVAIKVLPAELAQNAQLRARFARSAMPRSLRTARLWSSWARMLTGHRCGCAS